MHVTVLGRSGDNNFTVIQMDSFKKLNFIWAKLVFRLG